MEYNSPEAKATAVVRQAHFQIKTKPGYTKNNFFISEQTMQNLERILLWKNLSDSLNMTNSLSNFVRHASGTAGSARGEFAFILS